MAISFCRHTLDNGLRLLVHEDHTTPMASCNIVYQVGSRDENPELTGIAHLFEHYMFCGSRNIADFDSPLQKIGAINNAYTGQDHTHYYELFPANNLETVLWLESDRMLELAFEQAGLDTQKHVVTKEVCLNRPYGDMWGAFNDFVYEKYPYKWMPIGKEVAHIESVTMEIMKDFYYRYYRPDNAILVIGGNVNREEVVPMVEHWFSEIPAGGHSVKQFPEEPEQQMPKQVSLPREVPFPMLLKGWKMPDRLHPDFYAYDLLTDLFGSGQSSYLYQKFVTEGHLFTDISLTVSGTAGPGIVALVARPADGVDVKEANQRLNDFLYADFHYDDQLTYDLQKVKNKNESALLQNDIKLSNRTSLLAVSESISAAEDFAHEEERYRAVTEAQIRRLTSEVFRPEKESTMFYGCQ